MISVRTDTTAMDRDLLPKDSVKKLGLLKIYLLPKK
jgi:hypothetical protein